MTSDAPSLTCAHALFLDFDGTLAPIQDDPGAVRLPEGGADILLALAERLAGALAVISGRDLRDLSRRVPETLWRAGGHGLEICAPGQPVPEAPAAAPERLARALAAIAAGEAGARLEVKGPVLALHYRFAPAAGAALCEAVARALQAFPDYVMQAGKMVIEAKPAGAHKGAAVETLMTRPPFRDRTPLMIGDDVTDEDAMAAALRLGGAAIKVGPGETAAGARLADPDAVWAWLKDAARP